ncbi:MAG: hypothetical protein PHY66_04985 [Aliarcobacter sp.]|nr:hypothetical protein [Aliarcobacter sp.]
MIKLIIIWSLIIGFYLYTWIQSYNKTKSKSYVFSIIKKDIKNLLFGFIVVFTLYWIVDKYEEATNLKNMPKQEFDQKLFIPLTDKEKEVFQNNKIEGK